MSQEFLGTPSLIAGCLSLQRLGMDLPITGAVWDSKPRSRHLMSDIFATKLSGPLQSRQFILINHQMFDKQMSIQTI